MIFQPLSDIELLIFPETEVEAFWLDKFVQSMNGGPGQLTIRTGVMGMGPGQELKVKSTNIVPMYLPSK